jgi:hypothetical protein
MALTLHAPLALGAKERVCRHTKSKRADGVCAYGGCDVDTGDEYRCDKHRKAHAASERKRRADAAAAAGQANN